MPRLFTALLGLCALAGVTLAGDVIQLTDANFDSEMAGLELALVKFYAPWCGHCKKMAPEMEKAATTLKANDPPVAMVEVDCTVEKEVCGRFGVSGYPTLKIFRNGEVTEDYKGGRQAADFVKTMAGQAGPSSIEVSDNAKFEKVTGGNAPIVFGFFVDEDADGVKAFKKLADELREKVKFVHTYNEDVMKAAGKEAGSVHIFRPKSMKSKFEDQEAAYSGKFTVGLLKSWVKENINGLCPAVQPANMADAGHPLAICMYNVDYVRDPKGTQYWRNRVMKVATKFADKTINFAVGNHQDWAGYLNEAGKQTDGKKPVCLVYEDQATKFVMDDEFSMDSLEAFVTSYLDGALEPHLKSEGDFNNEGKANIDLTAKNYKNHVDGTKDAFIKFYAPWCGHCKSLAPKWEEMAEKFADDDSVVVAHFNADSNDVPSGFEVRGFPTIFWVPAGGAPQKYEQGRETKDLVNFVKKNKSVKKDEL